MDSASHSAAHDTEAALVVDRPVAKVLAPWQGRRVRKSLDAAETTTMASNLIAMTSNLRAMASNQLWVGAW